MCTLSITKYTHLDFFSSRYCAPGVDPIIVPVIEKMIPWTATKNFSLPPVVIQPSSIPQAGMGVFACRDIKKNKYITIYGGKYLDHNEAQHLEIKTHLNTIVSRHLYVDSNTSKNTFTMQNLANEHMVGGFVNGAGTIYKNSLPVNAKYTSITTEKKFPRIDTILNTNVGSEGAREEGSERGRKEEEGGRESLPRKASEKQARRGKGKDSKRSPINSTSHLLVQAVLDIQKGEEIIVRYGTYYDGVYQI